MKDPAWFFAHELGHQWNGGLVTFDWWPHLWMTHEMSVFASYNAVERIFPEWTYLQSIDIHDSSSSLTTDKSRDAVALEVDMSKTKDLDLPYRSLFKGTSLLLYLRKWIGDEAMKKGLKQYYENHAYTVAVPNDVWSSFEAVSSLPVVDVMSKYATQIGHPIITVTQEKSGTLILAQQRNTPDGILVGDEINQIWSIPIKYSTSKNPILEIDGPIMSKRVMELNVGGLGENDWININAGAAGFYRVQYSPELLNKFVPHIKSKTIPIADRMRLFTDLVDIVNSNRTSIEDASEFLKLFGYEDSYEAWLRMSFDIPRVENHFASNKDYQKFIVDFVAPELENIGKVPRDDDSEDVRDIRELILNLLKDSLVKC